jgi:hypothetical protein
MSYSEQQRVSPLRTNVIENQLNKQKEDTKNIFNGERKN